MTDQPDETFTDDFEPLQATESGPRNDSGWHPVNIGHLVMGVAFLGLTGVWALFEAGLVEADQLRWFMPMPWLLAGLAGLLGVVLAGRRRRIGEPWT